MRCFRWSRWNRKLELFCGDMKEDTEMNTLSLTIQLSNQRTMKNEYFQLIALLWKTEKWIYWFRYKKSRRKYNHQKYKPSQTIPLIRFTAVLEREMSGI